MRRSSTVSIGLVNGKLVQQDVDEGFQERDCFDLIEEGLEGSEDGPGSDRDLHRILDDEDYDDEETDEEEENKEGSTAAAQGRLKLQNVSSSLLKKKGNDAWERWKALLSVVWVIQAGRYKKARLMNKPEVLGLGDMIDEDDEEDDDEDEEDDDDGHGELKEKKQKKKTEGRVLREYTKDRIEKCRPLRSHAGVMRAIDELWEINDIQSALDNEGMLPKEPYVKLLVKFQFLIVPPPITQKKAMANAEVDWVNDMKYSGENAHMSKELFQEAMFELADTWAVNPVATELITVLETLLEGVTEFVEKDQEEEEEEEKDKTAPNLSENGNVDSTTSSTAPPMKKKFKLRMLIENNKLIKYNPMFGFNAERKFDGFRAILDNKHKSSHKNKLSASGVAQAIGKLYQAKWEQDRKNRQKKVPLVRFDKFVFEQYVQRYGTKKMAKRHLKRLFATVRQWANKGDACMRLFAVLCGIEIAPSEYDVMLDGYDPHFASDYFLPTIARVIDDPKQIASAFAQSGKGAETFTTLAIAFQMVTAEICKRTPRDSATLQGLGTHLKRKQVSVSDITKGDVGGNKNASLKIRRKRRPSLEGGGEPKIRMARRLSEALGERGILGSMNQQLLVDVHEAMLMALPVWQADRKWDIIFRFVASGKGLAKWLKRVRGQDCVIPKNINVLATPNIVHQRVEREGFFGVVSVNAATDVIEQISGINLRDALEQGAATFALQGRESPAHKIAVELSRKSLHSNTSLANSHASKSTVPTQPLEKGEGDETSDDVLFHPSPRTPRKVLEEARKRDALVNGEVHNKPNT